MRAISNFVFLLLVSSFACAQNKNPLLNFPSWEIKDGEGFPTENIVLIKNSKNNSLKKDYIYLTYEFKKNGTITESTHYPKNVGVCDNGLYYLKSGKWSYTEKTLTVDLLYCGAGTKKYKLEYTCDVNKDIATLVLSKTITETKDDRDCSADKN